MLRPGDAIKCAGFRDMWKVAKELEARGYKFTVDDDHYLTITEVPEVEP